jgi:hypothetical protein
MAITSSGRKHPCPRLQEDAVLAHEDPTVSYGGAGGGLLGLPACLTATLFAIFCGANLSYGSVQSLATKPRI